MCEKRGDSTRRSQYRLSMLFPAIPEAREPHCCHRLGDSVHDWSTLKVRKKIGNDNYVYMLWRYNDCCVRYTFQVFDF